LVAGVTTAAALLKPARVVARITTGRASCSENGGLGYLWVSNFKDATIARIDPATNRVTAHVKVGARPCGVAIGADALWVDGYRTDAVERVDPRSLRVVERIPVGTEPLGRRLRCRVGVATSEFNGTASRIDPGTNTIVATIKVGKAPRQRQGHLGEVRFGCGWCGSTQGRFAWLPAWRSGSARATRRSRPTAAFSSESR
jgi:YVTN family beta-propeller protein